MANFWNNAQNRWAAEVTPLSPAVPAMASPVPPAGNPAAPSRNPGGAPPQNSAGMAPMNGAGMTPMNGGGMYNAGGDGGTQMSTGEQMQADNNGLQMSTGLPEDVIITPTTVDEAYLGSLKALLNNNKGNYVVAAFLIGTQELTSWEGILYDVGNDFITIYQEPRDRYIVCDIYSLKFIEFYDTRNRGNR